MKGQPIWIVLALFVCLFVGTAPVLAAHGSSSPGVQGSAWGSAMGDTGAAPGSGMASLTGPGGETTGNTRVGAGAAAGTNGVRPPAAAEREQVKGTQQEQGLKPGGISRSSSSPLEPQGYTSQGRWGAGQPADHAWSGIMAAPGGGARVARSGPGSPGGYLPYGEARRDPAPGRQQRGPPEPGQNPCGPAQSAPSLPAQGQPPGDQKDEKGSRPRTKRVRILYPEVVMPEGSPPVPSLPVPPLFPFSPLIFGGYRRISGKNVLTHDARNRIYTVIARYPGIDAATLAGMTGINENTLRYHLVKLTANGKVTALCNPGIVRYFLNQGAYNPREQALLHYLWTETPREILLLLVSRPGMTRQQVSDALALSGPSVTRQMDHLIGDGIVENRGDGRSNHYYLSDDAARMYERLATSAPPNRMVKGPRQSGSHPLEWSTGEVPALQPPSMPRILGDVTASSLLSPEM